MKSNKNMVLDLLRQCAGEENGGVTTQYLSKRLDMQRTNLSAILNALVREGLVEKTAWPGDRPRRGTSPAFPSLLGMTEACARASSWPRRPCSTRSTACTAFSPDRAEVERAVLRR